MKSNSKTNEQYALLQLEKRKRQLSEVFQKSDDVQKFKAWNNFLLGVSILMSFGSGLTMLVFITLLLLPLAQYFIAAIVIGGILVSAWEYGKRWITNTTLRDYWRDGVLDEKWRIGVVILLVAGGATGSYFGGKWGTVEVRGDAETISFQKESALLEGQIADLKTEIKEFKTSKDYRTEKGELDWNIRTYTLPAKSKELDAKNNALAALQKEVRNDNKVIKNLHAQYTQVEASNYGLISAFLDFILLLCLNSNRKYEYKEAVALGIIKPHGTPPANPKQAVSPKPTPVSATPNQTILNGVSPDIWEQFVLFQNNLKQAQNNPILTNKTDISVGAKQTHETTETPVQQHSQPETATGETVSETVVSEDFNTRRPIGFNAPKQADETPVSNTETTEILVIDTDEKGIRNKLFQAFTRLYKQKSKDTPRTVLRRCCAGLQMANYSIRYNGQELTVDVLRDLIPQAGDRLRVAKTDINYDKTKILE